MCINDQELTELISKRLHNNGFNLTLEALSECSPFEEGFIDEAWKVVLAQHPTPLNTKELEIVFQAFGKAVGVIVYRYVHQTTLQKLKNGDYIPVIADTKKETDNAN